jgi:glycine/D-amino acid oxidase-like deaminating enzyme
MSDRYDYIIVGGGIFAAGTAFAIRQWKPSARIAVFKGTHEFTASRDKDKIIRSTYPEEKYRTWAEEALTRWQGDPNFRNVGWLRRRKNDSPEYLKGSQDEALTLDEMKAKVGLTENPTLEPDEGFWFNPLPGYIDTPEAVGDMLRDADVDEDERNVTRLVVEGDICLGVQVQGDGDEDIGYTATETIVAAGPWTLGILKRSGVRYRDGFFAIYGVGVAIIPLTPIDDEALGPMPILVTDGGWSDPSQYKTFG